MVSWYADKLFILVNVDYCYFKNYLFIATLHFYDLFIILNPLQDYLKQDPPQVSRLKFQHVPLSLSLLEWLTNRHLDCILEAVLTSGYIKNTQYLSSEHNKEVERDKPQMYVTSKPIGSQITDAKKRTIQLPTVFVYILHSWRNWFIDKLLSLYMDNSKHLSDHI